MTGKKTDVILRTLNVVLRLGTKRAHLHLRPLSKVSILGCFIQWP